MSFILDALKKADAERHAGELPDLRSALATTTFSPAQRGRRAPIALVVAAVALAAVATGYLVLRDPGRSIAPSDGAAARSATQVQPVGPADTVSRPAASPVVATEIPVPPAAPASHAAPVSAKEAKTARFTAAPASTVTSITVPMLAQMSPSLRAELPALAVGGSMYSKNPADRMLLIDKRMLHEGDEIAPGLLLESIQPKSAILRYKGSVFRLPL